MIRRRLLIGQCTQLSDVSARGEGGGAGAGEGGGVVEDVVDHSVESTHVVGEVVGVEGVRTAQTRFECMRQIQTTDIIKTTTCNNKKNR